MNRRILFVYNAESGVWNRSLDFAHKIISPSTYFCDLCNLTHGSFSEKKVWRTFRGAISHTLVFMYKDKFLKEHPENQYQNFHFPMILEEKENKQDILISAKELSLIATTEDLIAILKTKMV